MDVVASFNVEIGPEWTQRMNEFGILLDQPVEFDRGEVVALAVRMLEELSANDSESGLSIEALTWEILAAFGHANPRVENSEPQWLRDARDVLDNRFEESLSLRRVARDVGIHPVHFAAAFRRFQGCSPGQYLRRRRFERARHLILDPDASLAQVATDAGFRDQSQPHLPAFHGNDSGAIPHLSLVQDILSVFSQTDRCGKPRNRGVTPGAFSLRRNALKTAVEKLGVSPASGEIDALSQSRVFEPAGPRTTPSTPK